MEIILHGFLSGLLVGLAKNLLLLIILWGLVILLEEVWSGFSKLIKIILFPGLLLRRSEQLALAQLLGAKVKQLTVFKLFSTKSGSLIYMYFPQGHVGRALIVLFTPLIMNLAIAYTLILLLTKVSELVFAVILSWLVISLVVTGFPDKADLAFVFNIFVTRDPSVLLYYAWGIIAVALTYLAFGEELSLILSIIYYVTITSSLIFMKPRVEDEIELVFDEDEFIE